MTARSGAVGMRVATRAPRKPPIRLAGAATATASQSMGPESPKTTRGTVAVTAESADFNVLANSRRCSPTPRTPTRTTPSAPPK